MSEGDRWHSILRKVGVAYSAVARHASKRFLLSEEGARAAFHPLFTHHRAAAGRWLMLADARRQRVTHDDADHIG